MTGDENKSGVDIVAGEAAEQAQAQFQRAVALKYDKHADAAPRIVAKGRGAVAEQILALAFAHDVKVREDAPLVEILEMLEVDSLIPLEAYAAVAEILTYVYRANRLAGKQGGQDGG